MNNEVGRIKETWLLITLYPLSWIIRALDGIGAGGKWVYKRSHEVNGKIASYIESKMDENNLR